MSKPDEIADHSMLADNMPKEEYEQLDRTPTFTPTKRYNGHTVAEIHDLIFSDLVEYERPTMEQIEAIAKLLTEPRK